MDKSNRSSTNCNQKCIRECFCDISEQSKKFETCSEQSSTSCFINFDICRQSNSILSLWFTSVFLLFPRFLETGMNAHLVLVSPETVEFGSSCVWLFDDCKICTFSVSGYNFKHTWTEIWGFCVEE